jgi:hypothetical protein
MKMYLLLTLIVLPLAANAQKKDPDLQGNYGTAGVAGVVAGTMTALPANQLYKEKLVRIEESKRLMSRDGAVVYSNQSARLFSIPAQQNLDIKKVVENLSSGDIAKNYLPLKNGVDLTEFNKILKDPKLTKEQMHRNLANELNNEIKSGKKFFGLSVTTTRDLEELKLHKRVRTVSLVTAAAGAGSLLVALDMEIKDSKSKERLNQTDRSIALEKNDTKSSSDKKQYSVNHQ